MVLRGVENRAFPGQGTGPLSGPSRGFQFFPGIRVLLTGPGLQYKTAVGRVRNENTESGLDML